MWLLRWCLTVNTFDVKHPYQRGVYVDLWICCHKVKAKSYIFSKRDSNTPSPQTLWRGWGEMCFSVFVLWHVSQAEDDFHEAMAAVGSCLSSSRSCHSWEMNGNSFFCVVSLCVTFCAFLQTVAGRKVDGICFCFISLSNLALPVQKSFSNLG